MPFWKHVYKYWHPNLYKYKVVKPQKLGNISKDCDDTCAMRNHNQAFVFVRVMYIRYTD